MRYSRCEDAIQRHMKCGIGRLFGVCLSVVVVVTGALMFIASIALANPDLWKSEGWTKTDFTKSKIEWSEILSGGPPKDGIPSIDQPLFKAVSEIADLEAKEPVIGLEINGDARAYPLRILIWHEIVNDSVGGLPVTVTYCPLCNAALVFERKVNGRVLDFGTTGKLRKSDLVMYDRQTESWWQQFTGEAIAGDYAGTLLKLVPARLEAYADFLARNPDGRILVPNNPGFRNYGRNPYAGYDSSKSPFLFQGDLPEGIEPMARVVVARPANAPPIIVSMSLVRERTPVTIGSVRFSWKEGQLSALDAEVIMESRDVGTIEVTYAATGKLIPYDVTFAFVAHAFRPDIKIQQQ